MDYWRIGCRWSNGGGRETAIDDIFFREGIVFVGEGWPNILKVQPGDIFSLTSGADIIAVGKAKSSAKTLTDLGYTINDASKFSSCINKNFSINDIGLNSKSVIKVELHDVKSKNHQYPNPRMSGAVCHDNNYWKNVLEIYTSVVKEKQMENYIKLLKNTKNLILTGAPGTGKTYMAKDIAAKIVSKDITKTYEDIEKEKDNKLKEQIGFVQFHPSYDYTDFIEGLRPVSYNDDGNQITFKRTDGIFKEFCKKALSSTDKREYVFIIDEINRGEVSKIFGELFYCIEPGYRGEKGRIKTQYQNLVDIGDEFKEGFYVPENVYIIGTMNDIDRSVESMDFAFRRRFAWEEIKASDTQNMLDGKIGDLSILEDAKKRMNSLNDAIWNKGTKERIEGLSSAYHIGASYFLQLNTYKDDADKGFASLWRYHIKPLLQEYLHGMDDVDKKLKILENAYNLIPSSEENSNA